MTAPTNAPIKPAAFLSIKTQFDNLGDALINRELCRLVASRAETFIDLSRAPVEFAASMGVSSMDDVTAVREHGFARMLAEMIRQRLKGRACFLFLNPGGLGGKALGFKSRLSALAYNLLLGVMAICGVRICHVGISYDRMPAPESFIARLRRRALHSFCVRDQLSLDYVRSIGMPADGIVPDLSFNLYENTLHSSSPERQKVAFSFRFDGKAGESEITGMVRSIIDCIGPDFVYLFIVQVARDEPGMRRLQAACQTTGITTELLVCHDQIDKLSMRYLECSAIYSNRLHALLMAAHAGAAPYAVVSQNTQPKIQGMFNDLGLSENVLYLHQKNAPLPRIAPPPRERFLLEFNKLSDYFDEILGSKREPPQGLSR